MKKKVLKMLAQKWIRQSSDDEVTMRSLEFALIKPQLKASIRVRRTCAWELLRLLNNAEKENPSEEGFLCLSSADHQST